MATNMESISLDKNDHPRHHPEDISSAENSDNESTHSNTSKPNYSDDDNDEDDHHHHQLLQLDGNIPGTGPNDMPLFKNASQLSGSFQTGVKGVIADATSFETARRRKQKTQAQNGDNYSGYKSTTINASTPLNKSSGSSDVDNSDDEDFVRAWRKNRMAELRTGQATKRRQLPSKRKYGRVESVDASGYLDAIEKVSPETIVVVTICNNDSSESRFVEDCLFTLARRYQTTHFVTLHHVEAEMDGAMVPAVLAYKGGELFANIIRIVDEVPPGRSLSVDSLELVLKRWNVLHTEL